MQSNLPPIAQSLKRNFCKIILHLLYLKNAVSLTHSFFSRTWLQYQHKELQHFANSKLCDSFTWYSRECNFISDVRDLINSIKQWSKKLIFFFSFWTLKGFGPCTLRELIPYQKVEVNFSSSRCWNSTSRYKKSTSTSRGSNPTLELVNMKLAKVKVKINLC